MRQAKAELVVALEEVTEVSQALASEVGIQKRVNRQKTSKDNNKYLASKLSSALTTGGMQASWATQVQSLETQGESANDGPDRQNRPRPPILPAPMSLLYLYY